MTESGGSSQDPSLAALGTSKEDHDDSTFPTQSRPASSTDVVIPKDNNLYEVCKRATA